MPRKTGIPAATAAATDSASPSAFSAAFVEQGEHDAEAWRLAWLRFSAADPDQHARPVRPKRLAEPFQQSPPAMEGPAGLRPRRIDGATVVASGMPAAIALRLLQFRILDCQRNAADVAGAATPALDQVAFGEAVTVEHAPFPPGIDLRAETTAHSIAVAAPPAFPPPWQQRHPGPALLDPSPAGTQVLSFRTRFTGWFQTRSLQMCFIMRCEMLNS